MPGDNVDGFCTKKSRICRCEGLMMSSLRRRASWKVIEPPIASRVRAATSWPFPQNSASSSIPSSWITVLSTSKQTMSAARMISLASKTRFVLSAVLGPVIVVDDVDPLRTRDGIWGMATDTELINGDPPLDDEADIATKPNSDLLKLQLNKTCNISATWTALLCIFSLGCATLNFSFQLYFILLQGKTISSSLYWMEFFCRLDAYRLMLNFYFSFSISFSSIFKRESGAESTQL